MTQFIFATCSVGSVFPRETLASGMSDEANPMSLYHFHCQLKQFQTGAHRTAVPVPPAASSERTEFSHPQCIKEDATAAWIISWFPTLRILKMQTAQEYGT